MEVFTSAELQRSRSQGGKLAWAPLSLSTCRLCGQGQNGQRPPPCPHFWGIPYADEARDTILGPSPGFTGANTVGWLIIPPSGRGCL